MAAETIRCGRPSRRKPVSVRARLGAGWCMGILGPGLGWAGWRSMWVSAYPMGTVRASGLEVKGGPGRARPGEERAGEGRAGRGAGRGRPGEGPGENPGTTPCHPGCTWWR
ncbi:hypothetical protein GCM10018781_19010 [Kitasatospora indigofera]|uniref:Uncharacterized protein n=1 Tax=Kitasatospora indigofera TaxID=67307 RepID=A0A919KMP9_9ACTN|nr:hypothetical protein GCM10018781_19010 [Kitasatospora indigofera]